VAAEIANVSIWHRPQQTAQFADRTDRAIHRPRRLRDPPSAQIVQFAAPHRLRNSPSAQTAQFTVRADCAIHRLHRLRNLPSAQTAQFTVRADCEIQLSPQIAQFTVSADNRPQQTAQITVSADNRPQQTAQLTERTVTLSTTGVLFKFHFAKVENNAAHADEINS
jgi:hypothetical protein